MVVIAKFRTNVINVQNNIVHLLYSFVFNYSIANISRLFNSVVTVSKFSLAVGFGRFSGEKPRFRIRFRFLHEIVVKVNFLMSTVAMFNFHTLSDRQPHKSNSPYKYNKQ